jgi:hypothetical protein
MERRGLWILATTKRLGLRIEGPILSFYPNKKVEILRD